MLGVRLWKLALWRFPSDLGVVRGIPVLHVRTGGSVNPYERREFGPNAGTPVPSGGLLSPSGAKCQDDGSPPEILETSDFGALAGVKEPKRANPCLIG
jgi:hypothetical protein